MSTVVDAAIDDPDPEKIERTVYGANYIEVDEDEFKRVSPHLMSLHRVQDWLDNLGFRLIYGR